MDIRKVYIHENFISLLFPKKIGGERNEKFQSFLKNIIINEKSIQIKKNSKILQQSIDIMSNGAEGLAI